MVFRRRRMLAPINTNKHFVHKSISTVNSGAIVNLVVADSVLAPAVANTFDVTEGAVIKAVYIEIWLGGKGVVAEPTMFNLTVERINANATAMTFTNAANLQAYANKKNILYTTQGITGSNSSGPTNPIIRNWISIPKGKQRMGFQDKIVVNIAATGQNLYICGIFIYKEYR